MDKKIRGHIRHLAGGDEGVEERLVGFYNDLTAMPAEGIWLTLPNKQGMRNLLRYAAQRRPMNIVSTVCPDYETNDQGLYTFGGLGEGVGHMPRLHLKVANALLPLLHRHGVKFEYSLLVADLVEGTDPVVVAKFCEGDIDEFLRRCECTRKAVEALVGVMFPAEIADHVHAESFTTFYGECYVAAQNEFMEMVFRRREEERQFGNRFLKTHVGRLKLYRSFLRGYLDDPTTEQLEARTARGIAMYATHFGLLRLRVPQVVVINHRTINLQYANRADLARSKEEARAMREAERIPIFVIENKVY